MNAEIELKLKNYWDGLPVDKRLLILTEFRFWDGLANYRFEYIPEDLKTILMRRIK
jgi:hypothetical protein